MWVNSKFPPSIRAGVLRELAEYFRRDPDAINLDSAGVSIVEIDRARLGEQLRIAVHVRAAMEEAKNAPEADRDRRFVEYLTSLLGDECEHVAQRAAEDALPYDIGPGHDDVADALEALAAQEEGRAAYLERHPQQLAAELAGTVTP